MFRSLGAFFGLGFKKRLGVLGNRVESLGFRGSFRAESLGIKAFAEGLRA